jgi:hypothetical protein
MLSGLLGMTAEEVLAAVWCLQQLKSELRVRGVWVLALRGALGLGTHRSRSCCCWECCAAMADRAAAAMCCCTASMVAGSCCCGHCSYLPAYACLHLTVLACRFDRWPAEGGRPTATTEGLFEVSHARLVRLMALLCPAELTAALQQPLTSRLAAYPTPSGPQEKAEVAAVAESLAGLLAAAAPAAAAGGVDAGWAVALLRETLVGSSLEMSDAWSAALWWVAVRCWLGLRAGLYAVPGMQVDTRVFVCV